MFKTLAVGSVETGHMDATIHPRLVVPDVDVAVRYYQTAIAAVETARFVLPSGIVTHASLDIGGSVITLTEAYDDYRLFAPEQIGGSPVLLTLTVEDAAAVGDAMVAGGGTVIVPIEDRPYGKREGRVRDPYGHLWIVSQDIESLTDAELRARIATAYSEDRSSKSGALGAHPRVRRIVADLTVTDDQDTTGFYRDAFGLEVAMDLGWVTILVSRASPNTELTLMRADRTATVSPDVTIEVDDATEVHRQMAAAGWNVVHPLTREEWGVQRFFIEDPSGNVVNVMSHAQADR
jgi:PhnB protein